MDINWEGEREREIRRVVRVVFRGTLRFGKKTVSLRSSHNAYLEGAWRTNRPEVVNSTMETNKASNLRRMPLNVLLINLFGDGVNLALRWYISVSPKLCLTRLSKTWNWKRKDRMSKKCMNSLIIDGDELEIFTAWWMMRAKPSGQHQLSR